MAVAVGQRCVVRIKITDVELRKARDIKATIVSPQGEEKCQNVSFDEVSGVVYASVDVNSVGSWSMWLGVRFDKELFYTPAFVFAEVEGDAKSCDAPYIVDVEVAGESVSVTPPKVDVDAITREEFEQLSKDIAEKVDKVEGKGLSTNDFTDEYKKKVDEFSGGGSITIDKELSPTSGNAIANSAVVQGLAGLAEGVSEAIGNVAKNVEQNTADIKTKQSTLTLTTKPNGNIEISGLASEPLEFMPATPSGDPMHYAYEAVGATYNNTSADIISTGIYGDTIVHKAGHWLLNEIGDITNKELRSIYSSRYLITNPSYMASWWGAASEQRTNINQGVWSASTTIGSAFGNNTKIEIASLSKKNTSTPIPKSLSYTFAFCKKMHTILEPINLKYLQDSQLANTFEQCNALRNLRLINLSKNIILSASPLLSKESLLYMINNCASNATFTITLHPDVYAKCTRVDEGEGQYIGEWWDEIDDALGGAVESKNTNITLASA